MATIIQNISILLIVGLVGYASGRYLQPPKVETRVKEVEVIKRDIKIVERIVTRPDGTTIVDRRTDDHSVDSSKRSSETIVSNDKSKWHITAQAGFNPKNDVIEPIYGISASHRFIGPIFLGAWGHTDKSMGLSVGLEF